MSKGEFVYHSSDFCIPVTKAEPLQDIEFIIKDFIDKKLTFCLTRKDDMWEIWRLRLEEDSDKIFKDGAPTKPDILYVDGIEVSSFKIR
jgi:hypothetical protein